jgi:YD repeat-containing protein
VSAEVGGVVSTYAYNGLGQRTSQTVGGTTTEYALDVAGGLPEVIVATTGGASTYYVQVSGQILAQHGSGAWAYAFPDHLGSVRQLSNAGMYKVIVERDLIHGRFEFALNLEEQTGADMKRGILG